MQMISEIIDTWEHLSLEDKEYTIDVLHKNLQQEKRDALLLRVEEAKLNYQLGNSRSGSVDDLFEEIEDD